MRAHPNLELVTVIALHVTQSAALYSFMYVAFYNWRRYSRITKDMVEVMISHVRLTRAHSRGVQVACHLFSGEKDRMLIETSCKLFSYFFYSLVIMNPNLWCTYFCREDLYSFQFKILQEGLFKV